MTTRKRAAFLDRDGVINRMWLHPEFGIVDSPARPEQFELLPGVGHAIASLNRLGLLVIVVSNQPGISKGKFTPALLAAIERKMVTGVEAAGGRLDAIYNCLHHPEAVLDEYRLVCDCRKPQPGLLRQAAHDWNIDMVGSYMIGDGVTDIAAGCAVQATTLFVSSRRCYHCDSLVAQNTWPDYIVSDLGEAVLVIRALEAGDVEGTQRFRLRCIAP